MYCHDKDINRFIQNCVREGWSFKRGKGHGKLYHPTGAWFITISQTPSDHRCLLNIQRDIRRLKVNSE
jgi:hypothetical protein